MKTHKIKQIKCCMCGDKMKYKGSLNPIKDRKRIHEVGGDICMRCVGFMRGYPLKGEYDDAEDNDE